MDLERIYDTHKLNIKKLKEKGFTKQKEIYYKTYRLQNNFEVTFYITKHRMKIKVYDSETKEEYLPFHVQNTGEFVNKIKKEVTNILEKIVSNCYDKVEVKDQILDYVQEKYDTLPVYPFPNDNISITLKNKDGKWYGLIMEIPYKSLKVEKLEKTFIINLKNTEDKVLKLIDNKKYFKAYHMNKKYWYSIILNKDTNIDKLKKLIDESYKLVTKEKKS